MTEVSPSIEVPEDRRVPDPQVVVLDTSALVADPSVIDAFGADDVCIPMTVIEELDGLKRRGDDVGANARAALRALEALGDSTWQEGAATLHGGRVRIEPNGLQVARLAEFGLRSDVPDNRIVAAALGQVTDGRTVTVVSADTGMRLKAKATGLAAMQPPTQMEGSTARGWVTVDVSGDLIDALYADRFVDVAELPDGTDLSENQGLCLKAGSQSVLARIHDGRAVQIRQDQAAWDLKPRSVEQRFALDLLLDPDVPVVALDGPSGCGKTLLAVAAALEQVVEARRYRQLLVIRPLVSVEAEIGFLPGDVDEKIGPFQAAVGDALAALSDGDPGAVMAQIVDAGQIAFEPVTFLRGRSLANRFIIVDECQNMEPATIKTILTRVADGTKIVFTGDVSQIDHAFNSMDRNGLSTLMGAFDGLAEFGHVRLTSCERSRVAELAAKLL